MAGAVQWTIDQFWSGLQSLYDQIKQADDALQADKAALGALYSGMARNYDPSRDAFIAPAIHQNTVLRLQYLKPVKDKYLEAVNAARGMLKSAGYTAPQLSGLGALPIVPVIAAATVVAALSAVAIVWRLTQNQIARTAQLQQIYGDASLTPEQKIRMADAIARQVDQENKATPPPLGFKVSDLIAPLAVVALIVLGPEIMRMVRSRRAAA